MVGKGRRGRERRRRETEKREGGERRVKEYIVTKTPRHFSDTMHNAHRIFLLVGIFLLSPLLTTTLLGSSLCVILSSSVSLLLHFVPCFLNGLHRSGSQTILSFASLQAGGEKKKRKRGGRRREERTERIRDKNETHREKMRNEEDRRKKTTLNH